MAKAVEFQIKVKDAVGSVLKDLTIEATGLEEILEQIGKTAAQSGKKLRQMAEKSLVLDAAVRSVDQLRNMVGGLATPFNSFETAMRSANTMAGKSGTEFAGLTEKVVELSKNIPLAREELAGGLYQVISNGVPEDNWIEFLEKSSRSAVGGIANLGQTVTVTSTLIKNYGLSWDQAGAIQDKIQMTAKNGVTSFEQLGQALPRVSGSASQLGVTMDELMAVFATTTGVTGNTAEVSTQLAAVLNALVKPSAEATKAAEAMGIGFNASSVAAAGGLENFLLGLDASIQEYAAKTGMLSQTIYGQLFGSAEALRLLGSLTGEQKEKFSENIGAMADSAGAIDAAFEEMSSTGDSANQMLRSQIQSMMDWAGSIASTSAPYVEMVANTGMALMSMVQLGSSLKLVMAGLEGLKLATLAQAAVSKIVVIASNAWKVAQIALNIVLSANPIGIVVMAVAALVAAFILAYNNCESFRNICDQVWEVVKAVASAVWDFLIKAFEKVSAVVKKAWEWVKKFFGIKDEKTAKQTAELEKNTKATDENTKSKVANALAALMGNKDKNAPTSESDKYSGKQLIVQAKTYKELGNNIQYYQNKLEETASTEAKTIALYARKIALLKEQQEAIELTQQEASRPTELNTLQAIDQEIAYQQQLRERATADQLARIDAEIARLKELRTAFERSAHVEIGVDQIRTYQQLDEELQYYTNLLKTATVEERAEIQKRINALNDLRKAWDDTLDALKQPEDISRLNSIEQLDDAIGYYRQRQKKASAEEVADIQRAIIVLEKKQNAYKQLARIPELQDELGKLDGLSGKSLKMELELIGLDGVQKRLRELRHMLSDVNSPMDASQRAEVNKLIKSYANYERIIKKSNLTVEDSWGTIKGVAGGFSSLTDALQGNRGAWETISGVIDAAIQIYQGVNGIIQIVQALTGATATSNAVVTASGVATASAAATKIATTPGEVAAATASTAAVKAQAMAYRELAASEFMAAHASIPFAGAGIAAGFIAMMESIVGAVAVTPFANGGIVYGPTLALMGEYGGAKNNPEVVAPLNKLKSLLGDTGGGIGGSFEFRIKGRDLVGVLANETRIGSASGRKTNIKI